MVSQLVVLDADALTFGHPYNKRLPTVLPVWKSTSRVDGVRVDSVDCSQVIPIADLVEVSMYDQRRPERVRFKCRGRLGTRRYVLRCDEATDAVLLVGALRALTNARRGVRVCLALLYAIDATFDGVQPHAAKAGAAVAAPRAEQIRRDRGRVARGPVWKSSSVLGFHAIEQT